MENWGLVTYRESCLLADKNAALETKQSVAITVAHELSHQWFGDLVTSTLVGRSLAQQILRDHDGICCDRRPLP